MAASNDLRLQEALRPFHQRASEAEERLARLEAALSTTKVANSGSDELSNKVAQLLKMLEDERTEKLAEREKALKASEENAKLRYRITHLVRALEKADGDLAA